MEPGDAAMEMVEEAIEPFVDQIRRLVAMGLRSAASMSCRGVLLGLYIAERDKVCELIDWLPDRLSELADAPLSALLGDQFSGRTRDMALPKDLKAFAREYLPEWKGMQR